MADPISVAARRGEIVESIHRVHAVALRGGELLAEAGDGAFLASLRSAAKPFQAIPLAESRTDVDEAEIAIACASHQAEPAQLEAVRSLLAKAGGSEDDLMCGSQEGRPPGALYHNCSGKHAGMLAACVARGYPFEGYHLADHPLQQWILAVLAQAAGMSEDDIPLGVDGCGVPCFALPLDRLAGAFAALESAPRVAAAMRTHPGLVGGDGALDTELMEALPGWIAKRGAEGLLCAVASDGRGLALKVEDGNGRALRPALGAFLERLGLSGHPFGPVPTSNSRDEVVGGLDAL
jgi:L-asparaginase II